MLTTLAKTHASRERCSSDQLLSNLCPGLVRGVGVGHDNIVPFYTVIRVKRVVREENDKVAAVTHVFDAGAMGSPCYVYGSPCHVLKSSAGASQAVRALPFF